MLHCSSADQCRACLKYTRAANTTDFSHTNLHMSTCCTRPQSALKCVQHTCSCSLLTHRHKEMLTTSLCYLEIYACILSFPANINITLTITNIYQKLLSPHLPPPFPFSLQSRQQASLSLSVSLIPAFLHPIIFAANSALSNTLRFSRLPHPLNHLFTVPVFFTPYMSTAGINRQLSCSCCPPALYPSLFSSLLNPSFQPFFSLTSAVILGFPPLTCVTTTVHFLL